VKKSNEEEKEKMKKNGGYGDVHCFVVIVAV
jgi:hypothetical protein